MVENVRGDMAETSAVFVIGERHVHQWDMGICRDAIHTFERGAS